MRKTYLEMKNRMQNCDTNEMENGGANKTKVVENGDTRETELVIDGVTYIYTLKRRTTPTPEQKFNAKLQANLEKQDEEVNALSILYGEKFKIEDEVNRKYSIEFFVRGAPDASIQLSFPPEYPSDVPPTYNLNVPWIRKKSRIELYKALAAIFTENFGRCIIYLWVDKIYEYLKQELIEMKNCAQNEEEHRTAPARKSVAPKEENFPEIYKGTPIWDRGSCFSPYLAKVSNENEVQKVIAKIEDCRKVSQAWRNTYAYRFTPSAGSPVNFGEDGGEPKAGKNLLQRLINYNANNVIVYISRRFNGSLLGSDRFKHLNDAADEVLEACGYKPPTSTQKKQAKPSKRSKSKYKK